jgi:Arc/MetJ-type ribon-helix-helix transcriptional regulator
LLFAFSHPSWYRFTLDEVSMTITLSPETQKLLEARMKQGGFQTPDAIVRIALETLDQIEGEAFEQLDDETQAAIGRAEAQSVRGEGRPWEEVKAELRARYLKR